MTRALAVTLIALSVVLTAVTIWSNLTVRTIVGPAHFWAEFSRLFACTSWLILAMLWCTHRVVESNRGGWKKVGAKVDKLEAHLDESLAEVGERLDGVEDVIEDLDHDRIQANAIVISIFKNRKSM